MAMSRERLKEICVGGIDRLLNHPFLVRLTTEEREVLYAQRELFQSDEALLTRLLSLVQSRLKREGAKMANGPKKAFNLAQLLQALRAAAPFILQLLALLGKPTPAPVPPALLAKAKRGEKIDPKECCLDDLKEALRCIASCNLHAAFEAMGQLACLEDGGDDDNPDEEP